MRCRENGLMIMKSLWFRQVQVRYVYNDEEGAFRELPQTPERISSKKVSSERNSHTNRCYFFATISESIALSFEVYPLFGNSPPNAAGLFCRFREVTFPVLAAVQPVMQPLVPSVRLGRTDMGLADNAIYAFQEPHFRPHVARERDASRTTARIFCWSCTFKNLQDRATTWKPGSPKMSAISTKKSKCTVFCTQAQNRLFVSPLLPTTSAFFSCPPRG